MLRKIKIIWFVLFVALVFIGIILGKFIYAIYIVPTNVEFQPQIEISKIIQPQTDTLDYDFPLKDYAYITSTFYDFRVNHNHGGIDLGTNGRTGIPVYASRSGFVKRVSLSPFGYGKMVILSHDDEYQTVYAHLENFEKRLNEFVRSLQLKNLKQNISYVFDSDTFYYKKGDIIGYSGKSGSGAPHLHFEVRSKEGEQINPLLFPRIREALIDTLAPSFLEVKLVPIGANSRIDFSAKEKSIYNFFENPKYVSAFTHVDGKVGILVKVNDSNLNNGRDRLAIKRLSLSIDSKENLIFSKNYTELDSKNSRSVFLTRDLIQYSFNESLFFKLFDELGIENSGSGIISSENLTDGFHTVYVTSEDFYENTSTILFNIYSTKIIPTTSMTANATQIRFTSNETIQKFEYWMYDKKWKAVFNESITDVNAKEVRIPNKKFVGLFAKIKYQNYPNAQTVLFTSNGSIIDDISELKINNYYNSVIFNISSSSFIGCKANLLCITGMDTLAFPIHYNSPQKYFALLEPDEKLHGRVSFFISQNGQKVHLTNSNLIYISNDSLSIKTYDGLYEINFPQNSFYQPRFIKIGYVNDKIIFEPKNILLKNSIKVIRNTPFKKNERFFINTKDGWKDIITSKFGNNSKAEIKNQLYDITYAQDIAPPKILKWEIKQTGILHTSLGNYQASKSRPILIFRVSDEGFGINYDSTEAFINDEKVLVEYDPDISSFLILTENIELKKINTARIVLKDYAEHETRKTVKF